MFCADDENGMLRWIYKHTSNKTEDFLLESFSRQNFVELKTPLRNTMVPAKGFNNAAKKYLNFDPTAYSSSNLKTKEKSSKSTEVSPEIL